MNKKILGLRKAALIISAALPGTAFAQDASAPAAAPVAQEDRAEGDIVVTAQRREERLQDVPIAVSAATGEMLEASGVTSTQALSTLVPGLVMTQQRVSFSPYLRGVGSQNTAVGDEPAVATYVDGVYMASAASVVTELNNIERIEVLRGPQGTLFGRNATGGLISVITRDPSHESSGEASLSYGNYGTFRGNYYATGGLSENIAVDLAAVYVHQDEGFGRNVNTGEDNYYHRFWGVRSKLLWEPTTDTTITFAVDYSLNNSDSGANRGIYPGSVTTPGRNGAAVIVAPTTPYECFRCTHDVLQGEPEIVNYGGSIIAELDFGNASFVSTSAYRHIYASYAADTDGGAAQVNDIFLTEKTDTFQQEFLITGDAGQLQYTGGLFLFYSDGRHDPLLLRNAYSGAGSLDRLTTNTTLSYAPFMQLTYDFGQGTNLTAGLRYTSDRRGFVGRQITATYNGVDHPSGVGIVNATRDKSETFDALTYRLSLDHHFTPDFMVFASASRGFKSGVYNSTSVGTPASNPPVDPETLDAVEIGFKADFFDRQVRLNASVFHYDYEDLQLFTVVGPVAFLVNAAAAEIEGADIEFTYRPQVSFGDLTLTANAEFLPTADYVSFPNAQFFYPNPAAPCGPTTSSEPSQTTGPPTGGNLQCVGDASGNRMQKAPEVTYTLGVDYEIPLGAQTLGFNVTWAHNDGYFYDPDNRLSQEAFDLLNASINYRLSESVAFRVFGQNLLDEEWVPSTQTSTFADTTFPADPLTWGAGINLNF